jgi:signal transduction histidine kinase
MNLKIRIAFLFSLSVFIILLIFAVTIFIFNENFRREEFFARVESEAKEVAGVLLKDTALPRNTQEVIQHLAASSLQHQGICIFNSSFAILYNTPTDFRPVISLEQFGQAQQNGKYRFSERQRQAVILSIQAGTKQYFVVASAVDVYGRRKSDNLKVILTFSVIGGLLLSSLLAFFYVMQIIKPLENLKQQMQKIDERNLTERVKVERGNDEVSQIAEKFNGMLDRLEHAFEMRKNFVQHASHELRTPLANMLSQTEAALSKELVAEDYRQVLRSLKEDQQDMINLMNALLILSQYEKITYLKDWNEIRIDEVIYDATDFVKQLLPEAVVTVNFTEMPEKEDYLKIQGNEVLMRSAIQNLMKNAYHYSEDKKVMVSIDAAAKGVTLSFDNLGKQLLEEEQERLFIPFFRGENSINVKGFGLGLSIVQRVVTLHKGSISYKAVGGNINRFIVFLPAVK